MSERNGTSERFYTPQDVADLFKKDVQWVYRNRHGFLRTAALSFNRRLLLFDKAAIEAIISSAANQD